MSARTRSTIRLRSSLAIRSADDHDRAAQRASSVEILAEGNVLDTQVIQLIEDLEEVTDGSGDPVRGPHQDYLEPAAASIPQQLIEARAPGFGSTDPVRILPDDFKTPGRPAPLASISEPSHKDITALVKMVKSRADRVLKTQESPCCF